MAARMALLLSVLMLHADNSHLSGHLSSDNNNFNSNFNDLNNNSQQQQQEPPLHNTFYVGSIDDVIRSVQVINSDVKFSHGDDNTPHQGANQGFSLISYYNRSNNNNKDLRFMQDKAPDYVNYTTPEWGDNNNNNNNNRPYFKATQRNVTLNPGDRAVLKCKVENLGTKTVSWKKMDQVHPLTIGMYAFAPDPRVSVDFNQRHNEWCLIIQDVKPSDSGVYQCQISTMEDFGSHNVKLNVKNIQIFGTSYVEKGDTISLLCNASGTPELPKNIEWYKDSLKLESRPSMPTSTNHNYHIVDNYQSGIDRAGDINRHLHSSDHRTVFGRSRKRTTTYKWSNNNNSHRLSSSSSSSSSSRHSNSKTRSKAANSHYTNHSTGRPARTGHRSPGDYRPGSNHTYHSWGVPRPPNEPSSIDPWRDEFGQHRILITKKIETKKLISALVIRGSMMEDSGRYECRSSSMESASVIVQVANDKQTDTSHVRRSSGSGMIHPPVFKLLTSTLLFHHHHQYNHHHHHHHHHHRHRLLLRGHPAYVVLVIIASLVLIWHAPRDHHKSAALHR